MSVSSLGKDLETVYETQSRVAYTGMSISLKKSKIELKPLLAWLKQLGNMHTEQKCRRRFRDDGYHTKFFWRYKVLKVKSVHSTIP